jgi:hypothetical protein
MCTLDWGTWQVDNSKINNCQKKFSFLDIVWMHRMCVFDHLFVAHPKPFFVQLFSAHFIWMISIYPINFATIEK